MIDIRISNMPYVAEIKFKDGTYRQVDYAAFTVSSGFMQFLSAQDGTGPMVFVNVDAIVTVDASPTMQPVGGTQ